MSKLRRRYPGVTPFETAQADQYFGRTRDMQDLYDLIVLEKLVVLFGKSGYGKSSLLNAGIIPKLTNPKAGPARQFTPVVVKFASYTADTHSTPLDKIMDRLQFAFAGEKQSGKKEASATKGLSLWEAFKKWQKSDQKRRYVLIFDQFEEFFTYPQEQQVQFREQLAELLYTEIPQSIRDRWDSLSEAEKEYYSDDLNVRAVFAIREDRLSWLNSLKDDLPAILHKRYELKGLTDEQALEAIRKPAALAQQQHDSAFESHSFGYSPDAELILLEELKKGGSEAGNSRAQEGRIEAFLLQICCENIESRLIERARQGDVDIMVDPEDLPRFDRIYEEYYNNKINELPERQREVAKNLIEDELVSLNEATGVVFRLNADGRKLCAKPGVTEDLLKKLTDAFLLRSEPNTTGGFNYEISHDTLVAPVQKARELRVAEENARKLAREQAEKERELAEERRKRRRATVIAAAAVIALIASIYAFSLRNRALGAQLEAEKAKTEAQAAQKKAEESLKKFQEEQARTLILKGDSYFQNDEFRLALMEYQNALDLMPTKELIRKIADCRSKLNMH